MDLTESPIRVLGKVYGAASLPEIEPQNCIVLHSSGLATLIALAYTPLDREQIAHSAIYP